VQSVATELAERGYENTRFADVSAASVVAISTLQNYYFGAREDMLTEAMRHATDVEVLALEGVANAETDPWVRPVALIDRSSSAPVDVHRLLTDFWRSGIRDAELPD
jgi:AcrR family transcriptional regulator